MSPKKTTAGPFVVPPAGPVKKPTEPVKLTPASEETKVLEKPSPAMETATPKKPSPEKTVGDSISKEATKKASPDKETTASTETVKPQKKAPKASLAFRPGIEETSSHQREVDLL